MKKWLILIIVFIAGCSSNPEQQSGLFLLPADITTPTASNTAPVLIVKTNLAEYLDQVGLVYRTSDTKVVVAKQNRWAEKISAQINQSMISKLRAKQTTYWPVQLNSALQLNNQPQLQIRLTKFNGVYTGDAEVSGEWQLIDAKGALIKSEYFTIEKPLKETGYDQLVLSLSEGLDDLSTQIATQL
ncbi:PqiC family protein [Psychromonas aquatilis]|uniref:ABC-type transport auxiliary lipoprotein family protein n=1 Tax=Psychromonas aquatilis TaxID=2005072 RepID=A0ABU9GLQ9_9GAMM